MTPNYQMINPNPTEHRRTIAQLAADVFCEGKYVDQFDQNYIGGSHYDWNVSRIILDGDKLIQHWGVWGYQMRLESALLRVGGVGAVVTHPDYRKQGLMHRAAQASIDAMMQAGYDLTMLRGRHYAKMGYMRAWNYVTYRPKLEDLPPVELTRSYQPLSLEQVPAMDALYNRAYATYNGTAVRPTFYNRHPNDIAVYAWWSEDGVLEGYVRVQPDDEDPKVFMCSEAVGDPRMGLAVVLDRYKQSECTSLAFFTLPNAHPMLQLLRKCNCIAEHRYFAVSGWRVRIVNLRSTLEKLVPLFEKRLAESQFAGWKGDLSIDAGEQKALLHIEPGKVLVRPGDSSEHTLQGGAAIARLLIGSTDPEEIMIEEGMQCTGNAFALAKVLFPDLHPMLSNWDEY